MENGVKSVNVATALFGRRQIFTSIGEITRENIISEVNTALAFHIQNLLEEEFLYWYRRGLQPILNRKKEVRPEINNKVVSNHAAEIVAFKNGYFLTSPATYISRKEDKEITDKVSQFNEYVYLSGKHIADTKIVDWFHTVGKGVLYVKPNNDPDIPFKCYSLDPRSAFVVYSLEAGNEPKYAVNMVVEDDTVHLDVVTEKNVYRLTGTVTGRLTTNDPTYLATAISVDEVEANAIGKINIIEYSYNSVNMGSFEEVVPILEAINQVQSNRIDGIEQFIQSLAVAINCQFDEGTTANDIRQAGMIVLQNMGENKADFKILSEQLNQSETQVLVDYLYEQAMTICGMPVSTKNKGSTGDSGAAVLARNGWYQADTVARNTEDLFRESNAKFDEVALAILRRKVGFQISYGDFELNFNRNETSNVQSKAQACQTLLAAGFAPELAFAKSGVSSDPVADVEMSRKYLNMIWGNPDTGAKGEAKIIEEDRFTGVDETGGAI